MPKRTLTDAEWALVRAAYEAGREPVPDIAARHGLHPLTIRSRAWRQGWLDPSGLAAVAAPAPSQAVSAKAKTSIAVRPKAKPARATPPLRSTARRNRCSAKSASRKPPPASPAAPPPDRSALIARLYRIIDRKLDRMEHDMTSDDPETPADGERETRAIGTIAQSIERLAELETDRNRGTKQRDGDKRGAPGPLSAEETQRLSLELAERLAKLARRPGRG